MRKTNLHLIIEKYLDLCMSSSFNVDFASDFLHGRRHFFLGVLQLQAVEPGPCLEVLLVVQLVDTVADFCVMQVVLHRISILQNQVAYYLIVVFT